MESMALPRSGVNSHWLVTNAWHVLRLCVIRALFAVWFTFCHLTASILTRPPPLPPPRDMTEQTVRPLNAPPTQPPYTAICTGSAPRGPRSLKPPPHILSLGAFSLIYNICTCLIPSQSSPPRASIFMIYSSKKKKRCYS